MLRTSTRILALALSVVALGACVTVTDEGGRSLGRDILTETEVEQRISELQFQHGLELVSNMTALANIGDPAAPQVVEALESSNALTRSSCAWVLGAMGDRTHIPALRELLDDSVPGVRYEAAASLVSLGDAEGFSTLIEGLADGDLRSRYKCIEVLREVTAQDFGYEHDAAPVVRRDAVTRWIDWLAQVRASAL